MVEFLRGRHPEVDFAIVLGGDTYNDLVAGKWRRGEDLVRMARFAVVPRKGVQLTSEPPAQVCRGAWVVAISSSPCNRLLRAGLQHSLWG